ncbi:uncharacterized protein Z518_02943 [Rhinocladiella mackenziei CBS 650.93]|uniref:Uncharacterized protein n=1 Tax=Rhinocladiella mackenziei CBS 650.93 TaxID=1442369 RepID=A0A0D2G165_9EURO|nr:uncharacterized protein Z518_02943 [Rhinocladiella mackenziei CBS 650.93]KIX08287.1 hypothetical protein Z518_02943 [Rhinocladiella mackenziei CBS 650.93]
MTTVEGVSQTLTNSKDKVMGTDAPHSGTEPPAGVQGKGTASDPYDGGNAPGKTRRVALQNRYSSTLMAEGAPKSTTQTDGASSQPIDASATASAPSSTPSTTAQTTAAKGAGDRGRHPLNVPARPREEERDVSPGTLPDGTHAQTSGDRGESYEPGKLSRLKGKLPFGKR